MTVNDLYFTKIQGSTNNRAWSFGVWLKETVDSSDPENSQIVADSVFLIMSVALPPCLSVDSWFESVTVWKRWAFQGRPGNVLSAAGQGTRPGRAMSNDNALFVNMRQDTVNAKYNGAIYLSGLSENDQDNNYWDDTFLQGPIQTFLDVFDAPVVAGGGNSGSWAWSVVSKAFSPPSTPLGTAFEIFKAVPNNRVASQRRRRNKVVGWAN
jgi:hypothetical protein